MINDMEIWAAYADARARYDEAVAAAHQADQVASFRLSLGVSTPERIELFSELVGLVQVALDRWDEVTAIVAGHVPAEALLAWIEHHRGLTGTKAQLSELLELTRLGQDVEQELTGA